MIWGSLNIVCAILMMIMGIERLRGFKQRNSLFFLTMCVLNINAALSILIK